MRYITLTDIKTALGISGSTKDSVLKMQIKAAEKKLDSMLSVSRLDIHLKEDERHDATGVTELYLHDIQVVEIGEILDDTTVYTQDVAYDIDYYVLYLDGSLSRGKRNAHIDYASGWNASGIATLTVDDYSLITSGMIVTIAHGGSSAVALTEGTEWNASTSNKITAISIADAINLQFNTGVDVLTGVRAFALESTVYIVDETANRITSTITLSDITGITGISGGGTKLVSSSALVMDGVDFPQDLIDSIILMVGARLNNQSSSGIKSYKIGSKSVTFGDAEVRKEVKSMIKAYMRAAVNVI